MVNNHILSIISCLFFLIYNTLLFAPQSPVLSKHHATPSVCDFSSLSYFQQIDHIKKTIKEDDIAYIQTLLESKQIGPNTPFNYAIFKKASKHMLQVYADYITVDDYHYYVLNNDFNYRIPNFTQILIEKFGVLELPISGKHELHDPQTIFKTVLTALNPAKKSADEIFASHMATYKKQILKSRITQFKALYAFIQTWMRRCIKTFLLCTSKTNPHYVIIGYPKIINDYYAAYTPANHWLQQPEKTKPPFDSDSDSEDLDLLNEAQCYLCHGTKNHSYSDSGSRNYFDEG